MSTEIMAPVRAEAPDATPMGILQLAMGRDDINVDQLTKLLDMQERWEANVARKAFFQAMADFKKEDIVVSKDKDNKQYGSKYTSIGELINTVTPLLAKHGLSAEFFLDQTAGIKVGCGITHALGHSGEVKWMTVPVDNSGQKNPIQQIKSSVTYARILTFELATGTASKEGNADDDGNGSSGNKAASMPIDDFDYHLQRIESAKEVNNLQTMFKDAYKAANAAGDNKAMEEFTKAKDSRKAELLGGK